MDSDLHITEDLRGIIPERVKGLSSSVEEDLRYFYALLDMAGEELKECFTRREVLLLCEVFKNSDVEMERLPEWPSLVVWDFEDVEKYEGPSRQFKTNPDLLIEKLEKLTPLQALWLLYKIRLFWDGSDDMKKNEAKTEVLFGHLDDPA
ncbi:MAG: hypothetical protein U9R24_00035 [Thermodesulfobacteriota bacterium]|nr:hypothetical protein [Thermodesulfobacteriota bacterium]